MAKKKENYYVIRDNEEVSQGPSSLKDCQTYIENATYDDTCDGEYEIVQTVQVLKITPRVIVFKDVV